MNKEEEEEEEEGSEYFFVYSTCKWFNGSWYVKFGCPDIAFYKRGVKSLPHANKQIMCETKWVKELKSNSPPTRGFWKQIQLIHRRTKSKRKWTLKAKRSNFSLILEGEEQQK
jgi:hypothetical protein